MRSNRMPEEFRLPPAELATPPEPKDYAPEYTGAPDLAESPVKEFEGRSGGQDGEQGNSRHNLIKKIMLLPAATTVATLSIIFASYGADPLGDDFLNHEWHEREHWEEQEEHRDRDDHGHSSKKMGREYPGDLEGAIIHVYYVPTEELYTASEEGEEGVEECRRWVAEQGGDPDSMSYNYDMQHAVGYNPSDDAIIIGDPDAGIDNWYIPQGTVEVIYQLHVFYNAYESVDDIPDDDYEEHTDEWDEPYDEPTDEWVEPYDYYEFPDLDHLDPDFYGYYSGDVQGPEYYIRMILPGDDQYTYLKAGQAWEYYDSAEETTLPNAWYDEDTNTLTLRDFDATVLDVNLMGNGFTIRLEGMSFIDQLLVWGFHYGGSLTLTGDGSLVVNMYNQNADGGLFMFAEESETCLMIEDGVTLECYGSPAFIIYETTMDDAFYYGPNMELSGGEEGSDGWTRGGYYGYDIHNYTILGGDGSPVSYFHVAPKD